MIITVEPGLYFKSDDELVPERFRGIGVRIEDDVLITENGNEILSRGLPRASADVEAWLQERLGDRRGRHMTSPERRYLPGLRTSPGARPPPGPCRRRRRAR